MSPLQELVFYTLSLIFICSSYISIILYLILALKFSEMDMIVLLEFINQWIGNGVYLEASILVYKDEFGGVRRVPDLLSAGVTLE